MASDGLATRMGRPPGATPATIAKGVLYLEMHEKFDTKVATIAAKEGVSEQWVREQMKKARDEATSEREGAAPQSETPLPPNRPAKPQRLSERMLAHRAVLALRRDIRFPAMAATRKLLWLECVMEIHALGDDDGLSFGEDGDPFETHEEFASALGGTGEDLEALLRRGLLARLPDGGIDLPAKIGLKPKEKPRRAPMFAGMGARNAPGGGQATMFQVLPGGLSDAMKPTTEIPISVECNATETQISVESSATETPISVAGGRAARTAAAFAYASDINNKSSSSSTGTRAGESTESPISVEDDTTETPVGEAAGDHEERRSGRVEGGEPAGTGSDETADKRSAFAKLVDDALQAGGLKRRPKPAESGLVNEWLKKLTAEQILHVITNKMKENPELRVSRLKYFDPAMEDFLEVRHRRPARKSGSPATGGRSDAYDPTGPLSPADQAIKDLIDPAVQAWRADLHGCPWPPMLDDFKRAIGAGDGTLAHRWLDVWAAWDQAKRPAVLKPPPFPEIANADFAARLDECEDGLSAPDDPDDE